MIKTTKLATLIGLSLFAAASHAASEPSQQNVYDELMAKTVGQYKMVGRDYNYNVTGQLNYLYGFNELDSGFENSNIKFNTSTSMAYGVDLNLETGVKSVYDARQADYDTEMHAALKLAKDNHDFALGYDTFLLNTVLGSKVKMNSDTTMTKNPLGQQLSNFEGYGAYNLSLQNYSVSAAVDFDGNLYAGVSAYADNTDIKMHLFETNNKLGIFFDVGTVFQDDLRASFGAGIINDKWSVVADASYFVTDEFSVYGNVSGDEDYASTTVGAEYAYSSLALYVEGVLELHDEHGANEPNKGIMLGAKFMF